MHTGDVTGDKLFVSHAAKSSIRSVLGVLDGLLGSLVKPDAHTVSPTRTPPMLQAQGLLIRLPQELFPDLAWPIRTHLTGLIMNEVSPGSPSSPPPCEQGFPAVAPNHSTNPTVLRRLSTCLAPLLPEIRASILHCFFYLS